MGVVVLTGDRKTARDFETCVTAVTVVLGLITALLLLGWLAEVAWTELPGFSNH